MNFNSDLVYYEKNILMLDELIHKRFGKFKLCLQATGIPHQYRIETFRNTYSSATNRIPQDRLVRFKVHGGDWDLPDPKLLEVHACIAKFLHMKSQGEAIDELIRDFEEIGGLAPNGSTNIEDLLAANNLSLLFVEGNKTASSLEYPKSGVEEKYHIT
ncbi:hypothetical protein POX_g08566 [Penicillium oxalicum]|uniref:hypothetical protein n=1 Tax=Penicillium oxalicum TaxID=69781 RepID=UPI0020B85E65|nr:hypothetical protein POX_g08566 [Penicillium oxalicum]KAI2786184.1 hypothetical protein POX_g08566 [Penicillium oxalicum]